MKLPEAVILRHHIMKRTVPTGTPNMSAMATHISGLTCDSVRLSDFPIRPPCD